MKRLIAGAALFATATSAQTGPSPSMPQIATRSESLDCGSAVIKLAPAVLQPILSVCDIVNATLPIFARRDLTRVGPRIPYVEDDYRFYVLLLTTAAQGKGKPFLVPLDVAGTALTVSDFYSIGTNGHRPKLGIALDYIQANGGRVDVDPTTIGDNLRGVSKPWIAAIIGFFVKQARGNPMKGLKKYDVGLFRGTGR